jgi:phosphoglycerate dehydrogenase-like enzyme
LLQLYKQLPVLDDQQRNSTWRPCRGQMLAGRTMAIVGLGAIGTEVARRAHAFDMRLVAIRRRIEAGGPPFVEVHGPDELGHVVAMADVIVISAAATAATESLIGTNELASMRRGSILCNVARGSLVDEDAVIEALQSGRLRAAILDVTRDEPLPSASPLWTTPGVYLSSHSSATVEEYTHAMTRMFAENLRAYVEGRSPRNTVEFARGY